MASGERLPRIQGLYAQVLPGTLHVVNVVFARTHVDRVNAQTCHELHVSVMRSIALGLGIEESYFDDKIQEQYHNLRLLSYPSITSDIIRKDGQSRAGAHSG